MTVRNKGEMAAVRPQRPTAYDYVGDQVAALITAFGLQAQCDCIRSAYAQICRESLAIPFGVRPSGQSRINHDGTPFQFALTLGAGSSGALQFLGEAGRPGLAGAERLQANRSCIASVAGDFQTGTALSEAAGLLERMAPASDIDLLADPGGAFWIGVGFTRLGEPQLKIYINAAWGDDQDRWSRLDCFAAFFGKSEVWQQIRSWLPPRMRPLGSSITLRKGEPPSGRLYLSAYGNRAAHYEELAGALGGDNFRSALRQYARQLLGEDYPYPAPTAVCSFGFGRDPGVDFKVEWCGHCLFESDVQAVSRLRSCFRAAPVDTVGYDQLLEVLSQGNLSGREPILHSFVGIGQKGGSTYCTVYCKPMLYGFGED